MTTNLDRRTRIKAHIRHRVSGTAQKPRMTVFRSNTQIYVQVIDDVNGVTIASASSLGVKEKATKIYLEAALARAQKGLARVKRWEACIQKRKRHNGSHSAPL